MENHLITLMIALPFLGALVSALWPQTNSGRGFSRGFALAASLASTLCAMVLLVVMRAGVAEVQITESSSWIGSYAIRYEVGLDGLNILMVGLISLVVPLLIAFEWEQTQGVRGLHGLLLLLQSALLGTVCSQDLFLMVFFWGVTLLPLYFLAGVWGGKDREQAALRTMVTQAFGNALMFSALILIYTSVDPHTFSIKELAAGNLGEKTISILGMDIGVAETSFLLFSLGLAFRVPVWPLSGWYIQLAEQATASVFVVFSGLVFPVGAYLFAKVGFTLFPGVVSEYAHWIAVLGLVNLTVGAICLVAQKDLRLLFSFLTIAQMGLLLIGFGSLREMAVVGVTFQQMAFGLAITGAGLFIGVFQQRTGSTQFEVVPAGGLATQAPRLAVVVAVILGAAVGFPGSVGFVGQTLLFIGSFAMYPWVLLVSAVGMLLIVYALVRMYGQIFLIGRKDVAFLPVDKVELSLREQLIFVPLFLFLILFGLFPKPLIDLVNPTVVEIMRSMK